MDRFAICIGRELGSGGREAAALLSRRLGVPFYDKELLQQAALDSGLAPEFFERSDERSIFGSLKTLVSGRFSLHQDGVMPLTTCLSGDQLFRLQSETIRRIARERSAIFVGRCADYVLREEPRVYSVFLTASRADRIRRIMETCGVPASEAEEMIGKGDRKRAEYYDFYTFKKWGAASSYDLCINTTLYGMERTVELMAELAGFSSAAER